MAFDRGKSLAALIMIAALFGPARNQTVVTIAGNGQLSSTDGQGTFASFHHPQQILADDFGNIYVSEAQGIRKINSSYYVSVLAGMGHGTFEGPPFDMPWGLAWDLDGNIIVADSANNLIRKVTLDGLVSTIAGNGQEGFADGPALNASFNKPRGVAVDAAGNILVTDTFNHVIRRISKDGWVATVAGKVGNPGSTNGYGTMARFEYPECVFWGRKGNAYICESDSHLIRQYDTNGFVSMYITSALAIKSSNATFFESSEGVIRNPRSMSVDPAQNFYFIDDTRKIRRVTSSLVPATIAGSGSNETIDGYGTLAALGYPKGIAINSNGVVYFTDYNGFVRKMTCDILFCGPGTYQRGCACIPCSPGYYQPNSSQIECIPVPVGTYQTDSGARTFITCPDGMYQSAIGQSYCNPCPPNSQTCSTTEFRCKKGFNQIGSGCTPCLGNTFNPTIGGQCIPCPPNAQCTQSAFFCLNGYVESKYGCNASSKPNASWWIQMWIHFPALGMIIIACIWGLFGCIGFVLGTYFVDFCEQPNSNNNTMTESSLSFDGTRSTFDSELTSIETSAVTSGTMSSVKMQ